MAVKKMGFWQKVLVGVLIVLTAYVLMEQITGILTGTSELISRFYR